MRFRHFAAGFIFFAAFSVSVLITGVPKCETKSYRTAPVQKQTVRSADTELKSRIRAFLEADRETGRQFQSDLDFYRADYNDRNVGSIYSYLEAEETATGILVETMSKVKCSDLPDDFCAAWEAHYQAWSKKYQLLQHKKDGVSDGEINLTYDRMIQVAEKYDVYFSY